MNQQLEPKVQEKPAKNGSRGKHIAIAIVAVVASIGLTIYILLSPIHLIKILGNIWGDDISSLVVLNKWLIAALTLILGFASYYILSNLLSFNRVKRQRAIVVYVIGGIVFYSMMYLMTKDYVTDQCCALDLDERYVLTSCDWSVHPAYGTPVVPCTQEMYRHIMGIKSSPVERVIVNKSTKFFSLRGEPLLWYYQRDDGVLEFFDHSGVHPQFGVQLKEITPEVARQVIKYLEIGRSDMLWGREKVKEPHEKTNNSTQVTSEKVQPIKKPSIDVDNTVDAHSNTKSEETKPTLLNPMIRNLPNEKQLAVVILNENGIINQEFSNFIASKYAGEYKTTTALFTPNAYRAPTVQRLFKGDLSVSSELNLHDHVDFLCIGMVRITTRNSETRSDMFVAESALEFQILEVLSGDQKVFFSESVNGTGWSNSEANKNAISKLSNLIK